MSGADIRKKRNSELDRVSATPESILELSERVRRLEQAVFGPKEPTHAAADYPFLSFDFSGLDYLKEMKSTIDICLAILDYVFSKNPNHVGLTPDEIASIVRERFALSVSPTTVSVALLRAAGELVTRTKVPGRPIKYRYQILPKGQVFIQKKINQTKPQPTSEPQKK